LSGIGRLHLQVLNTITPAAIDAGQTSCFSGTTSASLLLCRDHLAPDGLYFVRIGQLQDSLAPAELKLSETEIKQLDEMF